VSFKRHSLFVAVLVAAAARLPALPPFRLESVSQEGILQRAYDLGFLTEGGEGGFGLTLEHGIAVDYLRHARSIWSVPELMSYCVPDADGQTACKLPEGAPFEFDRDGMPVAAALGQAQVPGWHLRRAGTRESVVGRDDPKVDYRFVDGSLVEIRLQAASFAVSSEGAWIRQIVNRQDHRLALAARYDDNGRLAELEVEGILNRFRYVAGELREWSREGAIALRCAYADDLLAECRDDDGDHHFHWRANPSAGDRRTVPYAYPVELAEDDDFRYSTSVGWAGITLMARRKSDGNFFRATINPVRKRIVERDYDGSVRVFGGETN